MKPSLFSLFVALLLCFSSRAPLHAEKSTGDDILRFINGDILHGTFEGINRSQKISWSRPGIDVPTRIDTSQITRLIFNKGKARQQAGDTSLIYLTNGDILPAEIISLSESTLEISTDYLGELSIPRHAISRISPNPWGGKLIYRGPFHEKGWTVLEPLPAENEEDQEHAEEDKKPKPLWVYSGASWYNYSFTPLKADFELSDTSRIQFDIAWKNRMQFGLALHINSTFFDENADDENAGNPLLDKGRSDQLPLQLGSGMLCSFHGSNVQLDAIGFDSQNEPARRRIHSENKNFHRKFSQTGQAKIDIRTDRNQRRILVYVNDELALKWEGKDGQNFLKGSGLAIMGLNNSSRLRLSNISVSEWHGEPDSALSMTANGDSDIVLLTNGLDRISGKVNAISADTIHVQSRYADLAIPKDQVSDISLSGTQDANTENDASLIQLQPAGRILGKVKSSENGRLNLKHPLLGMCQISLPHIALIDFMPDYDPVNLWDEEF